MEKRSKSITRITYVLPFLIFTLLFTQSFAIGAAVPSSRNVLYVGANHVDWKDAPVKAALELDETFKLTNAVDSEQVLSADLSGIEVVVIQDVALTSEAIQKLKGWVELGNALIIFSGPRTSENPEIYLNFGLISTNASSSVFASESNAVPITKEEEPTSVIINGFDWKAMPDFKNYTVFEKISEDATVLVEKQFREDSDRQVHDPLIFYRDLNTGRVLVYSMWVESGFDIEFRSSAFFNYLVYSAVITRAGIDSEKLGYSEWEYSPVPHTRQKIISSVLIGITIIFTIIVTKRARKKSEVPLDASALAFNDDHQKKKSGKDSKKKDEEELKKGEESISNSNLDPSSGSLDLDLESKTEGLSKEQIKQLKKERRKAIKDAGWDKIGLHKQISGFFNSLFTAILVAGPQLVLLLYIYPNFIMPFPNAAGVYSIVNDLFSALWLFLDVGTSIALVTYFSAHRIERPEKAVHYIQIFVYWQLLSGIVQFSVVGGLSLFYFPTVEKYAYLSYHFLIHSMIQFPGFLSVMVLTLRALQRTDLEQISTLLVNFVFKLGVNFVLILFFRWLFRDSVMYGELFGAIVGLNIGAWVGNFADFGFSYYLFRKAGYSGKFIFRWDFTKEEFIEVMKYGIRLVIGNVWVPAVATLQALIITRYVLDYGSEVGYYNLAMQIGQIIGLVGMFTDSVQAPIAEAWEYKVGHGKEKYMERVFISSFKWVNVLNFFLSTSLLVIGGRLIIGFAGPMWARAEFYFFAIVVFHFFAPYSWIGDKFLLGSKMPTTIMWIYIIEQVVRAIGLIIIVPKMGVAGLMWAYLPGLLVKNIILLVVIRKKITAPKMYYWQTWIAPGIAAFVNWALLESFARVMWKGDLLTSILLFFIAVLVFIVIYGFLLGFFGAWDENEMKELELAKQIGHRGLNYFTSVLYWAAQFAFKIKSPFIGKSKIDIWEQAQEEMDELDRMKKKLVI